MALFVALCAACLLVAGGAVAWAVVRDGAGRGVVATGPISDEGAPGSIARFAGGSGAVMFRGLVEGDHWNQVGLAGLAAPDADRAMLPMRCLRVDFAAGRGVCLAEDEGLPGRYAAYTFDADLRLASEVELGGLPSRTRVSPDARYGAATSFVTGHSYAEDGFSTETLLIDLAEGEVIANLEEFAAYRDDQSIAHEDFNYWGVTFFQDSNRFYATLATQGRTYLVKGDIAARRVDILRENVECPSISPDNTRLAYKKKVGEDLGGPVWRFHVLDLATMTETPLAEPRSIDDQLEWLDDGHLLYGDGSDTWILNADGSGQPQRFMARAVSPAVLTAADAPGGEQVASDPAAGGNPDLVTLAETDLGVAVEGATPARAGQPVAVTLTIMNHGPREATWLALDYVLPEGASHGGVESLAPSGFAHGCAHYPPERRVRCDAPALAAGATWTLRFTLTPGEAGALPIWVTVGAAEHDPQPANNDVEWTVDGE